MAAGTNFYTQNLSVDQFPIVLTPFGNTLPAVLYRVDGSLDPASPSGVWLQLSNVVFNVGQPPLYSYYITPGATFSIALEGALGDKGRRFEPFAYAALSTTREVWNALGPTAHRATLHASGRLLA